MRKDFICAVAVLALTSCSSDSLVSDSPANTQTPIAFTVGQKNITRATQNLEDAHYYDFGVWAYKTKTGSSALVMDNYQVGCAGYGGFTKEGASIGDWFYEGLNSQIIRYWDLSYENTNFYAYAPYNSAVTITEDTNNKTKTITIPASVNIAGTDHDIIYAGKKAANATYYNGVVDLQFKHLGAKVNLKFYEDIPDYKVELLEVTKDGNDIQATPAKLEGTTYSVAKYFSKSEATIVYNDKMEATATAKTDGTPDSKDNLIFKITGNSTDSKVVPQKVQTGDQGYLESPTTYYAVAQPTTSTTGFTFHVSYKLTAEDKSKEEIIVRDARVFVPASVTDTNTDPATTTYIAAWQPNTAYTYTFKITTNTNGSTSETEPDVTKPDVPTDPALYPIVFDNITIVDYENDTTYTKDN